MHHESASLPLFSGYVKLKVSKQESADRSTKQSLHKDGTSCTFSGQLASSLQCTKQLSTREMLSPEELFVCFCFAFIEISPV